MAFSQILGPKNNQKPTTKNTWVLTFAILLPQHCHRPCLLPLSPAAVFSSASVTVTGLNHGLWKYLRASWELLQYFIKASTLEPQWSRHLKDEHPPQKKSTYCMSRFLQQKPGNWLLLLVIKQIGFWFYKLAARKRPCGMYSQRDGRKEQLCKIQEYW